MAFKTLLLPGKYVQGPNALATLGSELKRFGNNVVLVWDSCVKGLFGTTVLDSLRDAGLDYTEFLLSGQTLRSEAAALAGQVKNLTNPGIVVGIGGGKTLDMAKAIAAYTGLPVASVPTVASNDSPTSSFTVWYTEDGRGDGFDTWGRCPDLVLVDSQVIAGAPVRMFIAGLGDALATWYEAKAVADADAVNCLGTPVTVAALTLARSARDVIFQNGLDALTAVRNHEVSPALEQVLEATILYSGVGFESGGLATAHQMANNMGILKETHGLLHGEEVAFGLATQLWLDPNVDSDERARVIAFMKNVGLPTTLRDIGLANATADQLMPLAEICEQPGSFAHNHPFKVTAQSIVNAMLRTSTAIQ
ncbi:MAG: glycerol dehydrogenase [Planctomycetia bacterium]|nr:glycerol dehydrogenase [Planctomycetia bacterium]